MVMMVSVGLVGYGSFTEFCMLPKSVAGGWEAGDQMEMFPR